MRATLSRSDLEHTKRYAPVIVAVGMVTPARSAPRG
jgi:hypothetical protein